MKSPIARNTFKLTALVILFHALSVHAATAEVTPRAAALITADSEWSSVQTEEDHDFKCTPNGTKTPGIVLVGRSHDGDENGDTKYKCATVKQFEPLNTLVNEETLENQPDDGNEVVCPSNKVLIGRKHVGDENATEYYTCANLQDVFGADLQVIPGTWTDDMDENDHTFTCTDSVLIGRYHNDDENGETRYLCGTLW